MLSLSFPSVLSIAVLREESFSVRLGIRYPKCHCAECHCTQSRGANFPAMTRMNKWKKIIRVTWLLSTVIKS
jgi:hypothetical protein